MFLEELNIGEAAAFINFVKKLAMVDKVFAKEEKKLLKDYEEELNIKDEDIKEMSLDDIQKELSYSSDRIKTIIYFELVGLALVDGKYDEKEIDFLDDVAEKLTVARSKKIAIANYFYNFKEICNFSVIDSDSKIDLLKEQAELLLK